MTGAACQTPVSRPLGWLGGGLGLKRRLMFGFVLIHSLFLDCVLDVLVRFSRLKYQKFAC